MSVPALFVGGWGYAADAYAALVDRLADAGPVARILAPSDLYRPGTAGAEAFLPALLEALAALPAPALLAGWSLGGGLALAAADRRPDRVARLLLIAATPRFVEEPGGPPGVPAAEWRAFRRAARRAPAATVAAFRARAAAPGPAPASTSIPPSAVLDAGLTALGELDLRAALGRLAAPLTIVHGTADAVIPFAAAEWLQHRAPDSSDLRSVPGAGHDLPLTHPALVARLLGEARPGRRAGRRDPTRPAPPSPPNPSGRTGPA